MSSSSFMEVSLGCSMCSIMSSANTDSLTLSFPIWIPFISFSSLITVARTSKTILSNSTESWHPCLVPHLRCWSMFSMTALWRIFVKNECEILWIAFSSSIEMMVWFSFFSFWCHVSYWLTCRYWEILASLRWIPLDHGTWSFLVYCCIQIANILLMTFEFMFISHTVPYCFLFALSLSDFGIRVIIDLIEWDRKLSLLYSLLDQF